MIIFKAVIILGAFLAHSQAYSIPRDDPCQPSPCGANANCKLKEDHAICECLPNYVGAPPNCHPECIVSRNCTIEMACINLRCRDPCPGTCGLNAICKTISHNPTCSCADGHSGDPFIQCTPLPKDTPAPALNNSSECLQDSDCSNQKACINKRCSDPCLGACGLQATCYGINHRPICSCSNGLTGDPFRQCIPIPEGAVVPETKNSTDCERSSDCPNQTACLKNRCRDPCPGVCGLKATCFTVNHHPVCSCTGGLTGDAFVECTPIPGLESTTSESTSCEIHEDCPNNLECFNKKCSNPCNLPGLCGLNASCLVVSHKAQCKCPQGNEGNPFIECKPISSSTPAPSTPAADVVSDPCVPFPCGPNARCNNGVCSNITDYVGVPYKSCISECTLSSDCPLEHACLQSKCSNPCPGTCGENAKCSVVNHTPVCTCQEGYRGDAFLACTKVTKRTSFTTNNICVPSPCGPNAQCKVIQDRALCSCLEGFVGTPPSCHAECKVNTDCLQSKACVDQRCVDPCLGACGKEAQCEVINHAAICSCRAGQTGDPCRSCSYFETSIPREDPCYPSPCGPNSKCTIISNRAICSCIPNFIGSPPNCRPECIINNDCAKEFACINQKCRDPCPGVCGTNARCLTINHLPICSCNDGHNGDPIVQCELITEATTPSLPTNASTCVSNADCPPGKGCLRSECSDPCPGACGENAQCNVVNHTPVCSCPEGYKGDAFVGCSQVVKRAAHSVIDPCVPSPCGPNSKCQTINDSPICSCSKGFVGTPPSCRAE